MFLKIINIYMKTPGLKACNFSNWRLRHVFFPVNVAKFLKHLFHRTPRDDCFNVIMSKFFEEIACSKRIRMNRIFSISSFTSFKLGQAKRIHFRSKSRLSSIISCPFKIFAKFFNFLKFDLYNL